MSNVQMCNNGENVQIAQSKDLIIDLEYVLETDLEELRDTIFKEDSNGRRYRERIIDCIKEIGVELWFEQRGLPTNPEGVWKNRYSKRETTLDEQVNKYERWSGIDDSRSESDTSTSLKFEQQGYYLWENYLPIDKWTDKDLLSEYKQNPTLQAFL